METDSKSVDTATPVVGVVGFAGSGKTALIKGLVREWAKRGRRVAVIKRVERLEASIPEAAKLFEAGVKGLVLSGSEGFYIEIPEEGELQPEIIAANYLPGVDLVLVESRESLNLPTIDVFRQDKQKIPLTRKRKHLLTVTGDRPPGDKDWPYVRPDDLASLADLVEKEVFKKAEADRKVYLAVDGRRVPMLSFVEEIIVNTLTGLIRSLKSCENAKDIELTIRGD